jgi:hypothetical protein
MNTLGLFLFVGGIAASFSGLPAIGVPVAIISIGLMDGNRRRVY